MLVTQFVFDIKCQCRCFRFWLNSKGEKSGESILFLLCKQSNFSERDYRICFRFLSHSIIVFFLLLFCWGARYFPSFAWHFLGYFLCVWNCLRPHIRKGYKVAYQVTTTLNCNLNLLADEDVVIAFKQWGHADLTHCEWCAPDHTHKHRVKLILRTRDSVAKPITHKHANRNKYQNDERFNFLYF